jgi:hypothetical protein
MKLVHLLVVVLAFSLVLVTGCQTSEVAAKTAELDEAIHVLEAEVGRFYLLGTSVTKAEVERAAAKMSSPMSDVERLTGELDGFDASEVSEAYAALQQTIDSIEDGTDSRAIMGLVLPPLEEFAVALEELHESGDFH